MFHHIPPNKSHAHDIQKWQSACIISARPLKREIDIINAKHNASGHNVNYNNESQVMEKKQRNKNQQSARSNSINHYQLAITKQTAFNYVKIDISYCIIHISVRRTIGNWSFL